MKRQLNSVLFLTGMGVCVAQSPATGSTVSGGQLFVQHCAPCHAADGSGATPAGRKLRVGKLARTKLSEAEIAQRIREGFRTPKGAERMPAFGAKLTAEEIRAITEAVIRLRK